MRAERYLYVIGDNFHHLGIFRAGGPAPGSLPPLDIADVAPLGPDGIFTSAQVTEVVRAIAKVNARAAVRGGSNQWASPDPVFKGECAADGPK